MAGSKLTLNRLLVMAAIGFGIYVWLSDEAPPPAAPTAVDGPAGPRAAPQPGYALNPRNSWPPESNDAGEGLAPDLFALNYFVVLDGSGSMSETECSEGKRKIEVARTALASFADSVPGQANLGLAVFDAQTDQGLAHLGHRVAAFGPCGVRPGAVLLELHARGLGNLDLEDAVAEADKEEARRAAMVLRVLWMKLVILSATKW